MHPALPPDRKDADDVMASVRKKSLDCQQNAVMVNEALKRGVEPDLDARIGLLADRFEVYAIGLRGCGRTPFVVSIDRGGAAPSAMIHGFLATGRGGHAARDAVIRHRRLPGAPAWET